MIDLTNDYWSPERHGEPHEGTGSVPPMKPFGDLPLHDRPRWNEVDKFGDLVPHGPAVKPCADSDTRVGRFAGRLRSTDQTFLPRLR
jgi:hypothetical protein